MKTMWKKVITVFTIAIVSIATSVGAVTYLLKQNNKELQIISTDNDQSFDQPFRLANFSGSAAENTDFTYAAEKAIHAVVHIKSTSTAQASARGGGDSFDPFEFFFGHRGGSRQPQPRIGSGSGVIISTDGYIITNNHVVERADELEVTLNDNRSFKAKLVGGDPSADIALLKIEEKDLPTLSFGDSEKLKVGEWVLAVGNPFSLKSTVTAGIVSAKGRSIMTGNSDRNKVESFIQTDAAVNPGNSGGALVNTKGELIGINTAIYSETGNFAGYSFAVPISIAGKIVADLKQYGAVQRAVLGVEILNAQDAKQNDSKIKALEGAYIANFAQRSSAKEAGMEIGDVITAVNGVKVRSSGALQEQVGKFRPGDKVKVEVDRYGSTKTYTVELRNMQGGTEMTKKAEDSADVLGAAFRALSDEQKKEYGVSYGIEVNGVSKGKVQDAGIRKGFVITTVNNQRMSDPEDIYRMVNQILRGSSDDTGLFIKGFYPNGETRLYAINLID